MNELALFAGAGGGILGGKLLGWRTVCAVECDAYAAAVLAQRQNDGLLDPFPVWSDIRTFNGYYWQGLIEVVSGGFPCQDISLAGKGAGIAGSRSGLWSEMARIIREVRPRFVYVENSAALVNRGLDKVLGDLAEMGFDAEWGVLSAADVGANHRRERIWILAYTEKQYRTKYRQKTHEPRRGRETVANPARLCPGRKTERAERKRIGSVGQPIDVPDTEDTVKDWWRDRIGWRSKGESNDGREYKE